MERLSTSTVNAFQIKRQAHAVSRRETSNDLDRWNPFRHVWSNKHRRSATWEGSDLEAQNTRSRAINDDDVGGSPIEHSPTAPPAFGDFATNEADGRTSKEQEGEGFPSQRTASSGDTATADSTPTARNRKPTDREVSTPTDGDVPDEPKKKKDHRMFKHVEPKEPFTVANQIQRTILNSWINILLVAAPIGIVLGVIPNMNPIAVFVVNFIAIIPLAAMLSFATEEIALRTGETLGGLLNASFGNAVELIVAIMALVKDEVVIVQTSLIGSILSNLLLVMGMCFFFGGLRRTEQFFNTTVAQTAASLLALAIAGIIIPTVFDVETNLPTSATAALSRGTAVILLAVYAGYLYFQLKTHQDVFSQESQKVPMRPSKHSVPLGAVKRGFAAPAGLIGMPGPSEEGGSNNDKMRKVLNSEPIGPDDDEADDPQLSFGVAMGTLVGATVLIAFCAEFLVDSINYVTTTGGISEEFLGLILLPIVGNAAEHATAVTVAIKDKMDLAIGVAVGSSMQVALFLIPLLVIIGWGMGNDTMNLSFDIFQVAILFVAVLLVNYLIGDGKSHWLEGLLLQSLYLIIAVCSWWYPAAAAA